MPVCEELIAGEARVHEGRMEPHTQICGLEAQDWCATDRMYVCSQHVAANHLQHTRSTASSIEAPPPEEVHGERRGGGDRRKAE